MSNFDFERPEVQHMSWHAMRLVLLNAMVEAVERARTVLPTEDPQEIQIRDAMIMSQLHMITAEVLGETEGKILRLTMTTDEEITRRRQEHLEAGRVGRSVKT